MNNFHPKVSIVIPVYNGSNYLREAIDSALAQTYDNIEIIVVNDGSTDNGATEKIAKSYGDKIRYFAKENGGVATALNLGIEKMTGEYFSWLSHDDMYEKQKIFEQVKLLSTLDEKNTVVACNAKTLFVSGVKKNEYIDRETFKFTDIFLATSAVVGVNGCALLIPKKAFEICGVFDLNLPVTQDYDLWFRIAQKFKFTLLEKNLVISRRHDGQDSVQKQKLCFEAGEKLHYDFLNSISDERFDLLFKSNPEASEKFLENYKVYKSGGYTKTASMMLKQLLRHYGISSDDFSNLFRSEIGQIDRLDILKKPKKKKRLLFYSNVWHRGGIERVLSNLFSKYDSQYDCILATDNNHEPENLGYTLSESISLVKINNNNQIIELMNLVSLLEVDVFIGNPNHSESFIDIYSLLKDTTAKSIAYNHGHYLLPYSHGPYLYPTALKIKEAFSYADCVIWLSQVGCNLYNIENNNGVYIPNPVSTDLNYSPKKVASKNVLAVARFDDEIKRIDRTLLVFKDLHRIDKNYHLDIVGNCPTETEITWLGNKTLSQFMDEQDIPRINIKFWGEQENVTSFYDKADFLLLTSRSEGFALVLIEAMSRGVPCAVLDYIGVSEIVKPGYNGFIGKPDNYLQLVQDINDAIDKPTEYIKLSNNARGSVDKFGLSHFYEKWDTLLTALIENKPLPHSLRPTEKIAQAEYEKIITEYEKLLKVAIREYIEKSQPVQIASEPLKPSIKTRFQESLNNDGFKITTEKIVRKAYKKTTGKIFKR